MRIDAVHDFLDLMIDKSQGAWFSPGEKDSFLDRAQMDFFKQMYGNPNKYVPGRATPPIAYGVSQKINDTLSPFKSNAPFTTDSAGIVTLPDDYVHLLSLNTIVSDDDAGRNVTHPIQIVGEDELIERLESQVVVVSLSNPFGIENGGKKIQLFPEQSQVGRIYYLRRPVAPLYDYTLAERVITYVDGSSVQFEWDDTSINTIMIMALELMGINLQAADIVQIMDKKAVE